MVMHRAGAGVGPDDFKHPLIADHLWGKLPLRLIDVNGRAEPAPDGQPAPPAVLAPEQLVEAILSQLRDAYLKDPSTLAAALAQAVDLGLLLQGIDRQAVRVALSFNAAQVRAGGFAVLSTCTEVEEARPMKVDAPALGKDLARSERIRQLRTVIDSAYEILDANETQVLGSIAAQVQGGLDLGWSVIQNNGELLRKLEPALAIRRGPAQEAQLNRGRNERRDDVVRGDTEARLADKGDKDPGRPQVVATVTTQAPPAATAPKAPLGTGPRRPGG